MDLLDLLAPKEEYVLTGTYREKKDGPGVYFEYKEIDYPTRTFGEVIDNIITTQRRMTIRTRWNLNFQVNSYITTQDGQMWTIAQVQRNSYNAENLRFMRDNPGSDFTLSLIGVEDAWGLE